MTEILESNSTKEPKTEKPKKDFANKFVQAREETLAKQEKVKDSKVKSVMDKLYESDEEYDARLAQLRQTDIIRTRDLKLKGVKIPGYRTHWASTSPNAKPSVHELRSRGYRAIPGYELVPDGHHSIDGAGFHILMALPEDIAIKREALLKNQRDEDMALVKKHKKGIDKDEKDNDTFMFEKNKFEEAREKPKALVI